MYTAKGEQIVDTVMKDVVQALGGVEGRNYSISEQRLNIKHTDMILRDIFKEGNFLDVIGQNKKGENILLKSYGEEKISQYTIDKMAEELEMGKMDSSKE